MGYFEISSFKSFSYYFCSKNEALHSSFCRKIQFVEMFDASMILLKASNQSNICFHKRHSTIRKNITSFKKSLYIPIKIVLI